VDWRPRQTAWPPIFILYAPDRDGATRHLPAGWVIPIDREVLRMIIAMEGNFFEIVEKTSIFIHDLRNSQKPSSIGK
jgi:hypothetical protein